MNKTIEEAAREASVSYCSKFAAHQEPYEIAYTEFLNGAGYVMSLPLSRRLTDEERERVRTMYNSLYTSGYISACGFCLELESLFGKELFGEGEAKDFSVWTDPSNP